MSIKKTLLLYRSAYCLANKYPVDKRLSVMKDYLSLYETKGLRVDEYLDFEFERQTDEFRRTFLGLNEQRFYLDYLNPVKYYSLARNKYMAHKMLEDTGVRKSELYCYYQPEARFIASEEKASNLSEMLRILKKKEVQSCVIKATESSHGDNVYVINAIEYGDNDCTMILFNGQKKKLSELLSHVPLIFESVIRQTEQFASFNPSSVNTIRIMTALYPDNKARLVGNFFKIGRSGRCVDNAGNGGNIDGHIDNISGVMMDVVQFDGWRNVKSITHHPDNNCQIQGVKITDWKKIVEQVLHFQECFPYIKVAGWDIAITDEGPVVIEVNDFWDRTGQLFIRRGWRNEIRDCYLAWRNYWEEMGGGNPYRTGEWRLPLKDKDLVAKYY